MQEYSLTKKPRKPMPQTGEKFNRWSLIIFQGYVGTSQIWRCVCECGVTKDKIRINDLRTGKTKSCGCLSADTNITHNRTHTTEYTIWAGMIQRCHNFRNKAYKNYGARGVIVCDRWLNSFESFYADMGLRPSKNHSIDRFPDKGGNYEPNNCRWATRQEQNSNRRNTLYVEIEGKKITLKEACEVHGIKYVTVVGRMKLNWPESELFRRVESSGRK